MARRRRSTAKAEAVADILIGYRRVSTQEQAESGAGLSAQEKVIDGWATANGKTIVWLSDEGFSAGTLDRPALQQGLAMIRSGQAGGIVVSKLDRLSRSMLDFAMLMDESQRDRWQLVALDFGLDTSTPAGELMVGILALFAQFERKLIGQRTKDGLAAKKAEGVVLGRPRIMSEQTVQQVVQVFESNGREYKATAEALNRAGVPTATGKGQWHPNGVRRTVLAYEANATQRVEEILTETNTITREAVAA